MKTQFILGLLLSVALAGNLSVDYLKDVDISSIQVTTYPAYNANSLTASTTDAQATNDYAFGLIQNAQKSVSLPVRSIDSLFSRLPSSVELDELVMSADSVAILRTLQNLISNDAIPCDQALAYALELLGRIRAAIQIKEFSITQLQVIIQGAKDEIARLQREVSALQDSKKNLWLDELKQKLDDLVGMLEPLYKQYNQVQNQIAPEEAKIAGYRTEIDTLRNSNDAERNRVSNDRLELTSVDAKIRDLQNQLQAAQQRKAYLTTSIESSLALIAKNEANINSALDKIREIEANIRTLRDQADALKAKTTSLQVQVERIRNDLSVAQVKADKIDSKIADYNAKIRDQEALLVDDQANALQRQVDNLKKILPTVQDEVNRQYFYCFGEGAFTTEKTGSTTVYIIRGEAFGALLKNTYGISFDDLVCCDKNAAGGKTANIPSTLKMTAVDITSPDYINNIGQPVTPIIETSNKTVVTPDGKAVTLPIQKMVGTKDHTCIVQEGVSGRGVIVGCDGNRYTVRNYANAGPPTDNFVEVALCTILMSTVKVPRVGMSMAYIGSHNNGIYQASMATVW